MKTITLLLLSFSFFIGCVSCSDDDNQPDKYQIKNSELTLFPDRESVVNGVLNYMYPSIDEETGETIFSIHFSGYFMLGLSGIAYNIPDDFKNIEIPSTGIKLEVSGEAKRSDRMSYPEISPIDFYCSSIKIVEN